MAEKQPEVDLPNMFFKGKPFINLVIASLMLGSVLGLLGVVAGGGFLGYLAAWGIAAAAIAPFILVTHSLFGSGKQPKTASSQQSSVPQISQTAGIDYCQEPERKTGTELMERGNQAIAPRRGR